MVFNLFWAVSISLQKCSTENCFSFWFIKLKWTTYFSFWSTLSCLFLIVASSSLKSQLLHSGCENIEDVWFTEISITLYDFNLIIFKRRLLFFLPSILEWVNVWTGICFWVVRGFPVRIAMLLVSRSWCWSAQIWGNFGGGGEASVVKWHRIWRGDFYFHDERSKRG